MKILYITPDITNSGGIARVISLKTNYMISKLEYEVHILTINNNDSDFFFPFNPKIQWFKIKQAKNALLFFLNYIRLIRKTISNEKPDAIIICDAIFWVLIPWFIKTKAPIIFETHVSIYLKKVIKKGFLSSIRFSLVHFLKTITAKKFDKFVVLTAEACKQWNSNNCVIIPNPVSFNSVSHAKLQNKKAIAICRHSYEKGLDRLLMIWKKVSEKHPNWTLDIIGEWNSDLKYQKLAGNLQISEYVNFIPPIIDIQKNYYESSIFLMASRSEAFPLVLLEAMHMGLPCIAYDCPVGPKAIIQNNKNGFLIEDGNKDSFVEKLSLLIKDENLRIQMGKKAIESVEKYDLDTIMNQWKNLLESIVKT